MKIIPVGDIRLERDGALNRVTASVGDTPVWFETRDGDLHPAPEAIASAFLLPAAACGARLEVPGPLDPAWLENAGRLLDVVRRWWRWRSAPPLAPPSRDGAPAPARADGSGLFFSGGVDSFHALLRPDEPIHVLVTVAGFDFAVNDAARAASVEHMLRDVAAARGARAVFVRTNVREHPLFGAATWGRLFGGAMAAVAHLLRGRAGRMLFVASTPDPGVDDRAGAHPAIDPLWSSGALETGGAGYGIRRIDKLKAIGSDPLVRRHLRVCWQNTTPTGNCSRCNKCVLAMLVLEEAGLFDDHPFEGRDELAARIDALRRTPDRIASFAELAASPRLDPGIAAAARRFVRRSRHEMSRTVRWRRRLAGAVLRRLGLVREDA